MEQIATFGIFGIKGHVKRRSVMPENRTGEYRIRAHNALSMASRATDEPTRLRFLEWAIHWLRLAQMGEKNDRLDLATEWPAPRTSSDQGTGQSA